MHQPSGEMEVWQSNRLVEASHAITLNEKRLIYAAAALHNPRLPMPRDHVVTLHAHTFAELFGITETNRIYELLAEAAGKLFDRRIREVTDSPKGKGKKITTDIRWVSLARYNPGEGTVSLRFSPEIEPYLALLHTEYTRTKLKFIANIGSYYGLRIYEILAQCRRAGQRSITLDELRLMLDLVDKYPDVKNLRVRVLEPALNEINSHTDLEVSMSVTRHGRKVTGFHFVIVEKKQLALVFPKDGEPC